jgi:hypothetical protein
LPFLFTNIKERLIGVLEAMGIMVVVVVETAIHPSFSCKNQHYLLFMVVVSIALMPKRCLRCLSLAIIL